MINNFYFINRVLGKGPNSPQVIMLNLVPVTYLALAKQGSLWNRVIPDTEQMQSTTHALAHLHTLASTLSSLRLIRKTHVSTIPSGRKAFKPLSYHSVTLAVLRSLQDNAAAAAAAAASAV